MADDQAIIREATSAIRLYAKRVPHRRNLAERLADMICDDLEAAGVTEQDLVRLNIISAPEASHGR